MRLTACIISKNEALTIVRAIKSLQLFADEVLVVDAESTDPTRELACQLGAKVITSPWKGFATQRNVCIEQALGRWILFLDADEEASKELGEKLKKIAAEDQTDTQNTHPNCYSIRRTEYFLGKELRYGPGNPSHQWRFFKKSKVLFEGEVHEYPRFEGGVGIIDEPIYHNPDLGIDRFLDKLNRYTTLEALDRFAQGRRSSLLHALGTFFTTFLKNGIRYRGFLNGKAGLILITLEAFSRVVRHFKLWLLWQVYEGKIKMRLNIKLPQPGSAKAAAKADLNKDIWVPPA